MKRGLSMSHTVFFKKYPISSKKKKKKPSYNIIQILNNRKKFCHKAVFINLVQALPTNLQICVVNLPHGKQCNSMKKYHSVF